MRAGRCLLKDCGGVDIVVERLDVIPDADEGLLDSRTPLMVTVRPIVASVCALRHAHASIGGQACAAVARPHVTYLSSGSSSAAGREFHARDLVLCGIVVPLSVSCTCKRKRGGRISAEGAQARRDEDAARGGLKSAPVGHGTVLVRRHPWPILLRPLHAYCDTGAHMTRVRTARAKKGVARRRSA